MKVVINRCWGGFGLSYKACMRYAELAGFTLYPFTEKRDKQGNLIFYEFEPYSDTEEEQEIFGPHYSTSPLNADGTYVEGSYWYERDLERNDPTLVQVVEELGDEASSSLSKLVIRDIPDGVEYEIDDYDGMESIHEKHRSW